MGLHKAQSRSYFAYSGPQTTCCLYVNVLWAIGWNVGKLPAVKVNHPEHLKGLSPLKLTLQIVRDSFTGKVRALQTRSHARELIGLQKLQKPKALKAKGDQTKRGKHRSPCGPLNWVAAKEPTLSYHVTTTMKKYEYLVINRYWPTLVLISEL